MYSTRFGHVIHFHPCCGAAKSVLYIVRSYQGELPHETWLKSALGLHSMQLAEINSYFHTSLSLSAC